MGSAGCEVGISSGRGYVRIVGLAQGLGLDGVAGAGVRPGTMTRALTPRRFIARPVGEFTN